MTTYRCTACGKDVEVKEIDIPTAVNIVQVIEVTPCEVCLNAAEEAVKEESYDKGYQEGWQAGYDTSSSEEAEDEAYEANRRELMGRDKEAS